MQNEKEPVMAKRFAGSVHNSEGKESIGVNMYRIILASASPRRREIMNQIGIRFEVIPSVGEEVITKTEPDSVVCELSAQKAAEILKKTEGATVVLGADTIVAHNGRILGKPADAEDAKRMIRSFAGDTHEVFTGVTVVVRDADGTVKKNSFPVRTGVRVRAMSEAEIDWYVATKEPLDKAGAYGIQGKFAPFIEGIDGDYYNVVGFPIAAVISAVRALGVDLLAEEYQQNVERGF